MARSWKYILFTLWCYYLILASIFLFSRGFLLKRDVFTDKAKCALPGSVGNDNSEEFGAVIDTSSEFYGVPNNKKDESKISIPAPVRGTSKSSIRCLPTTTKVILMIVDALRYDFISYNESLNESAANAYQNKIPVIHELLKLKPHNSRMYKFIADPPTTTMQRLKGITTGSLPTFIDVGSNFASSEINEDNIIDQLVGQNLSVVFIGDDTWTTLYPKRFLREFAYPSFNVWDLDTVDNGVMFHLIPEIQKKDWKLLIAHLLGVDHCGHKYGPNHPEMDRKLKEVNAAIRKVVDVMDGNMMLFVIGDHGMTSTGDHGGDSEDEVTAGLFVYSSAPLFPKDLALEETDSVSQVDIVPTLSFVLGVPIPFSNLGRVMVESIPSIGEAASDAAREYTLMALWSNAHQVNNYLSLYSEKSHQLPVEKFGKIHKVYEELNERVNHMSPLRDSKIIFRAIKEYLLLARNTCAEIWVQFDMVLMFSGLCFMFIFIFSLLFIFDGVPLDKMQQTMGSNNSILALILGLVFSFCFSCILYIFHIIENIDIAICSVSCCFSVLFIMAIIIVNWRTSVNQVMAKIKLKDSVSMASRIILLISLIGPFSNSYVVEDSTVLSFCVASLSMIVLYCSHSSKDSGKQRYDKNRSQYPDTPIKIKVLLLAVLFNLVIRLSHYYWRCREEQKGCSNSGWIKSPSSTASSSFGLHNFYTLIYLAILVTVYRMWLRSGGNLVGFSLIVSVVRYVPTVIATCTSAFWILQGLPKNTKYSLTPWQIHMWPCIIFFLLGISVISLYIKPLSIYKLPKTKVCMDGVYGQDNIIPHIFNQVKASLQKRNRDDMFNPLKDFPVVYGVATVYSAAVIIFSLFILLAISLVLGNHLAPSAALMFTASVLVLTIQAVVQHDRILMSNQLFSVPWASILWWALLSSYFFYGTGHHPTFPSIQWDAAFVGTGGHFSNHIVPAILVGMNTFASQFWFSVILPLVLISPFTLIVMFPKFVKKGDGDMKRGELILYEKESLFHHCMFILCSKYVLLHGLRVLSCMLAAAVHSRHLMVWKIFAPKFIFESLSLLVTMVGVFIGFVLVLRVTKALKVMMHQLE